MFGIIYYKQFDSFSNLINSWFIISQKYSWIWGRVTSFWGLYSLCEYIVNDFEYFDFRFNIKMSIRHQLYEGQYYKKFYKQLMLTNSDCNGGGVGGGAGGAVGTAVLYLIGVGALTGAGA